MGRFRQPRGALPLGRYLGAVRQVKAGSYDFTLIHAVPGQPERVFEFPLQVR